MPKRKIHYRETYKKGTELRKETLKELMESTFDNLIVELKQRTIYDDGAESITVELKFKSK